MENIWWFVIAATVLGVTFTGLILGLSRRAKLSVPKAGKTKPAPTPTLANIADGLADKVAPSSDPPIPPIADQR